MAHVTIDGRDFEMDTLTGEARVQAANIMIIDQEIARLQTQIKIFTVARAACVMALQQGLPKERALVSNPPPFISYAQNYEDVMLLRAFKDVAHGFFIDVGANDPIGDSVTCAFYQRGWVGINIEPLPTHFADFTHLAPDVAMLVMSGSVTTRTRRFLKCWMTATAWTR
jgi:hypothetical protein